MIGRTLVVVAQVLFVALLLGAWQWGSETGYLNGAFIGQPLGVAQHLVDWVKDGTLAKNMAATMAVLLVGFVAGMVCGALIGTLIGRSPILGGILEPYLIFFNGMPRLILQPFFIIWLGFGFASKVALVIAVIVVVVAVNVASALQDVDRDLLSNIKVLGAGRWGLFRQVYLPSLALNLFSTSRATIGFAFQAALVSEFVGTNLGLGGLIVKGQNLFDVNAIWAALLVVVILSSLLDLIVARFEFRATSWMVREA